MPRSAVNFNPEVDQESEIDDTEEEDQVMYADDPSPVPAYQFENSRDAIIDLTVDNSNQEGTIPRPLRVEADVAEVNGGEDDDSYQSESLINDDDTERVVKDQPYTTRNKPTGQTMFSANNPVQIMHQASATADPYNPTFGSAQGFNETANSLSRPYQLRDSTTSKLHNLGELRSEDQLKLGKLLASCETGSIEETYMIGANGERLVGKLTPAQFGLRRSQIKNKRPFSKTTSELDTLLNLEKDVK